MTTSPQRKSLFGTDTESISMSTFNRDHSFEIGLEDAPLSPQQKLVRQTRRESPQYVNEIRRDSHPLLVESENNSMNFETEESDDATISRWTIGWLTPLMLVGLYTLAIVFAIIHYILFRYLDGKRSDGGFSPIPQSYITTISTLLVTAFGISLVSALSVAFTQYLWYIMRSSALRVSTIDSLFCIRENPLLLARPGVISATPVLFLLALFSIAIRVVITYPPGALTVVRQPFIDERSMAVSTFDPSSIWNSDSNSSVGFPKLAVSTFTSSTGHYARPVMSLTRLAKRSLLSGQIASSTSPCGLNCSYKINFQGPYMQCDPIKSTNISTSFTNSTIVTNQAGVNFMYVGKQQNDSTGDPYFTTSRFKLYTSRIIGFWPKWTEADSEAVTNGTPNMETNTNFIWESNNLTCSPHRAEYTTTINWKNGERQISHEAKPLEPLVNLSKESQNYVNAVNESQYHQIWINDSNLQALFESLTENLSGWYSSLVSPMQGTGNNTFTLANGTVVGLDDPIVMFQGFRWWNPNTFYGPNGTIVADTQFNANSNNFSNGAQDQGPRFSITQELLNEALFNITMSALFATDLGNQSTQVTSTEFHNVFSFSGKLIFFFPYCLTLGIAVPFLILGAMALRSNGVSASEGGFLQLLCTTTGSKKLERAGAGGCLGGSENVPQELKDVRIRFGEVIDGVAGKEGLVRRAGFGTEDEVKPLRRDTVYGAMR